MEDSNGAKQVAMHKNSFDRIQDAIDRGFYLEAIFQEYAAMESRLEAILSILGMPCNRHARKQSAGVGITQRHLCLNGCIRSCPKLFAKTRIPEGFFTKKGVFHRWLKERDQLVHGLLKNESLYSPRLKNAETLAKDGLTYTRLLYNEAKRLNRICKNHPELLADAPRKCKNTTCHNMMLNGGKL